jgi:hypothetical protein
MSEAEEKKELLKAVYALQQLVKDQAEQIEALKAQSKAPFTLEKKIKWDEIGKILS